MDIPVWSVMSWEPVHTTTTELLSAARRMRPLTMHVLPKPDDGSLAGQLLWGVKLEAGFVGVAWEFVEFQDDCFSMADPMTLLSNAEFADLDDAAPYAQARLLWLNNVVHDIRWNAVLRRHVRQPRGRTAASRPLHRLSSPAQCV